MGGVSQQPAFEDQELSPILHEEIERLPAKVSGADRALLPRRDDPDRAAVELGWPVGTVRGRLAPCAGCPEVATDPSRPAWSQPGWCPRVPRSTPPPSGWRRRSSRQQFGPRSAGRRLLECRADTALLLRSLLRDMAVARFLRTVTPLALIAGLVGGAAVLLDAGRGEALRKAQVSAALVVPVSRSAPARPTDELLPDGALSRLGTMRFAAGATIHEIAYSPDGPVLASIDGDGELELWDAATGRRRHSILGGEQDGPRIEGMTFAPDGRTIAARSMSSTILYEMTSGRPIRRFEEKSQVHGRSAQAIGLAFSPSGSILAASFSDAPLVLWDVGSGRRIRSFDAEFEGTVESGVHARWHRA